MGTEIRPIEPDEFEAFATADLTAFGEHPNADDIAVLRKAFEFERSLAAFDGPRIVGTTGALSLRLTTPGGELPITGVTNVAVLPSHRRRGILTSLMRRQLEDVRDRGEPVLGLFASEGAIYGRFGYGLASMASSFEADRRHVGLPSSVDAPGRVVIVDHDEALRQIPAVYERVRPTRAGMFSVSDPFWEFLYADLESWRPDASAMFYALHETSGHVDGYLAYRVRQRSMNGVPGGTLLVRDLLGETPAASSALWSFAFGVDLIETVEASNRPVDEPLLHMVAEPRRLRPRLYDALYLRILDVPAALSGRVYSAEGTLVLDVHDGFCPWNEGRYELDMGHDRASCASTTSAPDLRLDASDLAAVYLGGTSVRSLADAGRVVEERPGALALAGRMFAADPPPWCPITF